MSNCVDENGRRMHIALKDAAYSYCLNNRVSGEDREKVTSAFIAGGELIINSYIEDNDEDKG